MASTRPCRLRPQPWSLCGRLPAFAGTFARIVAARDERAAVERHDVKRRIVIAGPIGAAHAHRAPIDAVAARRRETSPVFMLRRAGSIALGLIHAAAVRDDVAAVVHCTLDISVQAFNLSGCTGLAAWPGLAARSVSRLANLREAPLDHCFHRAADFGGVGPQLGSDIIDNCRLCRGKI
jgi:hypothetical protein